MHARITGLTIFVICSLFGFFVGKWVYSCDASPAQQRIDYIAAYQCETEEIMIVDGVEKVRYLCNAESDNDDDV